MLAGVTAVAAARRPWPGEPDARAPLRVVHVDTERGWGGGQRQLRSLAAGLEQRGHRCWVVARPGSQLESELASVGVPVIPVAPRFEWDPAAVRSLHRVLGSVRADVVHAHTGHGVALAALASVGTAAQVLVTRRVALPLRRNPLSRWKYGRPARIIAVSERVRQVLQASGIAASRIAVVRSGIDLDRRPTPASEAVLAALGVDRRHPLVVMVSALVPPHKDPETFVAAIAAARAAGWECQALLVGAGPLAGKAERACRRLGLGRAVRLTGFRKDALELLTAADVAVLSSRDEGLGTSLLEAMNAGVPVVATAAGGITEVVRDGVDGLLAPVGDAQALGSAIARILATPGLRAALVTAAHERVKEFSAEGMVEGTLQVYRASGMRSAVEAHL